MRPEPIHIVILLGLLLTAAVIVAAVIIVTILARRSQRPKAVRPYAPVAAPVASVSVADELAKLTDLRDRGVLSADEYETQKRRLLGNG